MRYYWLLMAILGLAWGQSSCPYVRYILFDACGGGCNEGNREMVIMWSGSSGFNINDLRITFPNPANTTWCNSGCGTNTLDGSDPGIITAWNAACGTSVFLSAPPGTFIDPNKWVVIITGTAWNTGSCTNLSYYSPSGMCSAGVGGVYVVFASNTNTAGRFANLTSLEKNKRMIIDFPGNDCDMTINYCGRLSSGASDGNYFLINPSVCIGQTWGSHNADCNTVPDNTNCYIWYDNAPFNSPTQSSGISPGNSLDCALPSISILPVLWAYAHIEGSNLVWHATGLGGDERARLSLEYASEVGGAWSTMATGLPLVGRYPLYQGGFYRLAAPLRDGGVA
ncbi:MAG: hypothetical protein ABDH66_04485, partial [Bacteroidia bacterium]